MNYAELFQCLHQHDVRYLICGGLALNLHGVPRMTADVDIILDLHSENLKKFETCASKLNYKLTIPVKFGDVADDEKRKELIQSKNLIALSFYNYDKNFLVLDVLIDFPIAFDEMWGQKAIRNNGGSEIYLVSIDHLIKLKEYSNRIQDQQDIYFLSKIKNAK
ncbi:MAG: hypothetical protein ABI723_12290 [Bacteroidia bacterium]